MEQAVTTQGTINLFEKENVEISIFDESFLEELSRMKEKNIALETLKRLVKEQVRLYQRTSVVKAKKFSELLQK